MTSARRQEIALADADATEAFGADIARWLGSRNGAVLFLRGDLGAGKTTFARGLLRALGIAGPVRSPTYTLLEPYDINGRTVLHMDLYRLQDPEELVALGVRDFPSEHSYWIVEWPERGAGFLPQPTLDIELRYAGTSRVAQLTPAEILPVPALPGSGEQP